MAPIKKISGADTYSGQAGFCFDIENIEGNGYFIYFHCDILASHVSIGEFQYNLPRISFHAWYDETPDWPEYDREIEIESLSWQKLGHLLANYRDSKNYIIRYINSIISNNGSFIPTKKMVDGFNRSYYFKLQNKQIPFDFKNAIALHSPEAKKLAEKGIPRA